MIDLKSAGARRLNKFLKMAVVAGVESAIQIHIDRGDDLNARDGNGLTPLMLSAAKNKFAICKLLLDAGADNSLVAPSGKTAHAIAVAANAHEAASVLRPEAFTTDKTDVARFSVSSSKRDFNVEPHAIPLEAPSINCAAIIKSVVPTTFPITVTDNEPEDPLGFDLSGWEAEEDTPPPDFDPSVARDAGALQASITKHEPFDSSEDWDDIDLYLPERSMPLARAGDTEARELLRLLLLRAAREGSVPSASVETLSRNDDYSANPEAAALLTMVINDLGAEVDERFEYITSDDNFEVFVSPDENPSEEETVDEALFFIDSLASRYSEPLRIYQKEFQRERLISAEDEVSLGKAMEAELERALDALASWPRGVELTLEAGNMVKAIKRPLMWMALGQPEPVSDPESETEQRSEIESYAEDQDQDPDHTEEEIEHNDGSLFDTGIPPGNFTSEFSDAISRLQSLSVDPDQHGAKWREIRETIASLRLNRRFLLEMADAQVDHAAPTSAHYARAMRAYQSARERMITANLKLVFHLAKKYLYSGEPLDDLAQEGNIGLMKAVERYDWRRGFKFSTYATWWIRQHIGRHVADKCKTIRVPVHIYEKTQRVARETLAFEAEIGRPPGLDEIASRAGISPGSILALRRIAPDPLPIHEISIDEMIAADAQPDFASRDPLELAVNSNVRRTIDEVLATLKPKEEKVMRLRYGLGTIDAFTLEEVGQRYQVTRERIRQIEAKAMKQLMQPSRLDALSLAFFGVPSPRKEIARDGIVPASPIVPIQDLNPPELEELSKIYSVGSQSTTHAPKTEKLLDEAQKLGAVIDDDRKRATPDLWIKLIDARESPYRNMFRKLMAAGFELTPGKGFGK